MTDILPCPFCGSIPGIIHDVGDWCDDARYVQLALNCCVTLTETMGWRQARELTIDERYDILKGKLIEKWNTREITSLPSSKLTEAEITEIAIKWSNSRFVGMSDRFIQDFAREILKADREKLITGEI